MNLSEIEEIIADFNFKRNNNENDKSILTNKRLIIRYKKKEVTFPLDKITSIGIEYKRRKVLVIMWIIMLLWIVYLTIFKNVSFNYIDFTIVLFGVFSIWLGLKGFTRLYIGQSNGRMVFTVFGKNNELFEFKDKINSTVSYSIRKDIPT